MTENLPQVEPTPVQLTRIEGILKLIDFKTDDTARRMSVMEINVEKLKTDVHTLQLEAVARDKLAGTVASTLKDADAAILVKNEQKWTPLTRLVLVVTVILYTTTLYFLISK